MKIKSFDNLNLKQIEQLAKQEQKDSKKRYHDDRNTPKASKKKRLDNDGERIRLFNEMKRKPFS